MCRTLKDVMKLACSSYGKSELVVNNIFTLQYLLFTLLILMLECPKKQEKLLAMCYIILFLDTS